MTPTDEQVAAITMAQTGDSLAVEALAGAGKTSTLDLIAREMPARIGTYVAFNKSIVTEATAKFPRNVKASTAHSLAFRAVGRIYSNRLNAPRMRSSDVGRILRAERIQIKSSAGVKFLTAAQIGSLATRSVGAFCMSADDQPGPQHVPWMRGLAPTKDEEIRVNRFLREQIAKFLPAYWHDLQQHEGRLPFSHNCYLKLWQLARPYMPTDFILLDEAQDTNPVLWDVLAHQDHAQLMIVGDRHQSIYGWNGAVDIVTQSLEEGIARHHAVLSQSFRFGPAIAEIANIVLRLLDSTVLVRGTEGIDSKIGHIEYPDAVLCRTNAGVVGQLIRRLASGQKCAMLGGADDVVAFIRGAQSLQNKVPTEHPDLMCFGSWTEVLEYVKQDETGSDLKVVVTLVDTYGPDALLAALSNVVDEASAEVVLSTAHKAKGREWNKVTLGDDFMPSFGDAQAEELRLLYVACTRAKRELDIDAVDAFDGA
jgi:superfamily I DNA/RNA helicase